MAGRTIQARRHMIDRLTGRDSAIMTQAAVGRIDTLMRKRSRNKGGRIMAHRTVFRRRQMIDQLAERDHVVVAIITTRRFFQVCLTMAERARGKCSRSVANTAVLAGRHMVDRFTDCGVTVAGSAIIHDTGVIKRRTDETGGVMTETAVSGCSNVVG